VSFGTPWYALLGLVGLLPVAVALQRLRAAEALRAELGLAPPPRARRLLRVVAVALVFVLGAAAAAQPAVRTDHRRTARADAELLLVLDDSRSMLASSGRGGRPRYARALAFARRLHAAFPEVPAGVASLNNRVLPYLFPTSQEEAFQHVLERAYGIETPPPEVSFGANISTLDALEDVAQRDYFSPGVTKRVMVVLTDAETLPFRVRPVLHDLRKAHVTPVVVRFWRPQELIYRANGKTERYRPTAPDELDLLHAYGWTAFDEARFGSVRRAVSQAIGSGPVHGVSLERLDRPIAPYLAALALIPLLVLLAPLLATRVGPAKRRSAGPARVPVVQARPAE
jgi:hypothetical protein